MNLVSFCWVSIFLNILITNNSWTVAQTSINHINFWKSVIWTFRCIYVNSLEQAQVSCWSHLKIAKKMHFLDNLSTMTQEGNMEARQITPLFYLLCLQHSFFHLTIVQIHFHVVPTLLHSCLYKEPQFWAKTTDLDSPSRKVFSRK